MAETERAKQLRQTIQETKDLKAKWGTPPASPTPVTPVTPVTTKKKKTPTPVTPKKKKGTIRSIIQKIKDLVGIKKKKEEYTLPAGVKTPKQIREFQKIMKETGK